MNCSEKAGKMYRFFQYVSSFLVQYSKTKKACPCGQVFFCFLSSNEVKSRFEPLYLATMPLTTSICFFRHAACAHQTPQREFAKAAFCLYQMLYPKGVADVNRFIARICFSCTFFHTKFKRKKHLPSQILQQKGIFHSKKFVFYSILLCFIHII